jgi:hypothetical protein
VHQSTGVKITPGDLILVVDRSGTGLDRTGDIETRDSPILRAYKTVAAFAVQIATGQYTCIVDTPDSDTIGARHIDDSDRPIDRPDKTVLLAATIVLKGSGNHAAAIDAPWKVVTRLTGYIDDCHRSIRRAQKAVGARETEFGGISDNPSRVIDRGGNSKAMLMALVITKLRAPGMSSAACRDAYRQR